MAQEIRDLSGTISLAMLKTKEFQIDLADGRTILAKVQE
jgi:translation initiation factor IF-1